MTELFAKLERQPTGVRAGVWVRRAILALFGVLVLLALLNRYGQRPDESVARGAGATMRLSAPAHVRGGLFFQSRLDIRAAQAIDHPRIVLDDGWLEGMQVNSIEPAPVGEASRDGKLAFDLGHIPRGGRYLLFVQLQVNPTNVGRRSQDVELYDGERRLLHVDRTITIFP